MKPDPPKVQKLSGGGLFQEYEWMHDSYDNFLLQQQKERIIHEQKTSNISAKPFGLGMN